MNIAFKTKTQHYLYFLENKNFCLKELSEKCVEYYNPIYSIKVFIDHYFEISIYVYKNNTENQKLNIIDIVEYLKFKKQEVEKIKRNQCTIKTIDNFYRNVVPIPDKVISLIFKNENIFVDCNKYVHSQNQELFLEEEKSGLQSSLTTCGSLRNMLNTYCYTINIKKQLS